MGEGRSRLAIIREGTHPKSGVTKEKRQQCLRKKKSWASSGGERGGGRRSGKTPSHKGKGKKGEGAKGEASLKKGRRRLTGGRMLWERGEKERKGEGGRKMRREGGRAKAEGRSSKPNKRPVEKGAKWVRRGGAEM